jgi:hypothetical protein
MSAIWDIFVASVMSLLFATMRIALFCFLWGVVLMALPTILRAL